jgi:hypothetical protein
VALQILIILVVQELLLDELEKLFGLAQSQTEMFNPVAVFFQRHDLGHRLFMAIIAA